MSDGVKRVILWKRVIFLVGGMLIALVVGAAVIANHNSNGRSVAPAAAVKAKPKTQAQKAADRRAHAKAVAAAAARERAHAKAVAAAAARERAHARAVAAVAARAARAHAAYVAAANRWHQGYDQYSPTIYYRWRDDLPGCSYVACWHIEVTTKYGCSSLFVEANELQKGTNVGDLIDSRDNVTPETPVRLELDSSVDGPSQASAPTITCNP